MKLYLNRKVSSRQYTDGVLLAENGRRICDCAENAVSMLAEGMYKVVLDKYKGRRCPLLYPAESMGLKSGSHIVCGNGVCAKDFGANIIVGEYLVAGVVVKSSIHFNRLMKRIEKSLKRGSTVEVVIGHDGH